MLKTCSKLDRDVKHTALTDSTVLAIINIEEDDVVQNVFQTLGLPW